MEIFIIITGISLAAAVVYFMIKTTQKKNNSTTESSLMLQYIEALRKEIRESNSENRKETQSRLDKITERLTHGLETSSKTLQDNFKNIQKQSEHNSTVIREVTEQLTKIRETNKQVLGFSEKMQSLENILKNPKQRGILGEYFLESLLNHVLQPNQYKMQYEFANKDKVDAVVFMRDKIIPIDAKFSLEKYNQIMEERDKEKREKLEKEFKMDVKNRIDETSKYIRPSENTMEFALMFIPAEGVYYNLLIYKVNQSLNINANDLIEYAFKKHVIIVSPTSFFAYLETILQGLNAMKMEESIKEVVKRVGQLGRHIKTYEENMKKLGGHLGTTVSAYNNAYHEFHKIDKDVYKITDGSQGGAVLPELIDKPSMEV